MNTTKLINNLNIETIKNSDPKDYITLMSHALRLGALYKAKFFMWLENNNYELIAQDDEILEHFIKEILNIHKKAQDEASESNVDFADNIFYTIFKESGKFSEADCISLSLVLLAFISHKSDLISNEEYKTKASTLEGNTKLLCKLGKGIETAMPSEDIVLEAFKEITYDEKSWEKE